MDRAVLRAADSGGYIYELWHGPDAPGFYPVLPGRPYIVGHTQQVGDALSRIRQHGVREELIQRTDQ